MSPYLSIVENVADIKGSMRVTDEEHSLLAVRFQGLKDIHAATAVEQQDELDILSVLVVGSLHAADSQCRDDRCYHVIMAEEVLDDPSGTHGIYIVVDYHQDPLATHNIIEILPNVLDEHFKGLIAVGGPSRKH